eukprot:6178002-Pleurochrysis_carterae.AAC.4
MSSNPSALEPGVVAPAEQCPMRGWLQAARQRPRFVQRAQTAVSLFCLSPPLRQEQVVPPRATGRAAWKGAGGGLMHLIPMPGAGRHYTAASRPHSFRVAAAAVATTAENEIERHSKKPVLFDVRHVGGQYGNEPPAPRCCSEVDGGPPRAPPG